MKTQPSFFTLLLLISFGSVNAVLFTPALPVISHDFAITIDVVQQTIIWFLLGYTIGQLIYSPIANRFGRKHALYMGISLQIISSFLCVISGYLQDFNLLVAGRFLLALGSGVGLKMTFTLVNEIYEPKIASQKIAYLIMSFAITPGLSIALGGVLTEHVGWSSCFYAGTAYGIALLVLVMRLPETLSQPDMNALQLKNLFYDYYLQFKNIQLVSGGLLMGGTGCFNYAFVAFAPFIAIKLCGMSSIEYGYANLLPPVGLLFGSLISAHLAKLCELKVLMRIGLAITAIGIILMIFNMLMHVSIILSLFVPMMVIFFGLCFIIANASTIAMSHVTDKSHGSAVLNFLNLGFATVVIFFLNHFSIKMLLLPSVFIVFLIMMIVFYKMLVNPLIAI